MKSLSYKIGLGYFVLICINIAIAVFAIYHINRLGSPVERVLKEKYQNVSAAENMAQALMQQVLAQDAMVENKLDSSQINNFNTYNKLYGSIGTIIVLMLWLQINCLFILVGFELNASIAINRDLKQQIPEDENL